MDRYDDFETLLDDSLPDAVELPGLDPAPSPLLASGVASPFDLVQPHRLTRGFERTVRGIAETFAKSAGSRLSGFLRASCVLRLSDVRPGRFVDTIAELTHPSCLALVTLPPLRGGSLISIDPLLMTTMLTRLLGGPVEDAGQPREFTALELAMARRVVEQILDALRGAAEAVVELTPQVERIDTNPSSSSLLDERETVLNLQYAVTMETVAGSLGLHFPLAAFEPVRSSLDPHEHREDSGRERSLDRRRLEGVLQRTEVDVAIRMPAARATLRDIASLGPDCLLRLGHPVSRPVEIEVEGQPLWRGLVEHRGPMRAVRIVGNVEEI